MLSAILAILGSSTVGSLIGGIFAFLNKKADIEIRRLDQAHELELRKEDRELAKVEAEGKLQVAVAEAEGSIESARMTAIGQAHAADTLDADEIKSAKGWAWLLILTDVYRRLIRPNLTLVLVGMALYLNWLLVELLGAGWGTLSKQQQYEAAMQAFAWITGQASAVIGYWFVSRGQSK
ncbi:MAG: hypothetical protein IM328_12315 [Microcystis sp. M034S1]|uniref:hypothetical protein n=1 Tax=Microcystis sp. M034S1 TaxID=2771111 RepID=UPI00258E84D3|nr:hypothetical protein [Microcystis sp. M034S1]MCA2910117.1 hypothetical protein [Microcystis sp. M034S1]